MSLHPLGGAEYKTASSRGMLICVWLCGSPDPEGVTRDTPCAVSWSSDTS